MSVHSWVAWIDDGDDVWSLAAVLLVEHPNDASKIAFELAIENLNAGLIVRVELWSQVVKAIEQLAEPEAKPLTR